MKQKAQEIVKEIKKIKHGLGLLSTGGRAKMRLVRDLNIKTLIVQALEKCWKEELKFLEEQYELFENVRYDEAESPSVRRIAYLCSKPFKKRITHLKQTIKIIEREIENET